MASGAVFGVKVMQNAAVATSGTAVTITFDKSILQVASFTRGPAFANAPLFLAGDATAIANANKTGKIKGVAAAFFPPGNVPAGDQEFLTIGFKAIGCGTSPLTFALDKRNDGILDGRTKTYGAVVKVDSTAGGSVQVCAPGASANALGASFDPNASASIDPNASPSLDPNASASASPGAGASVEPVASTTPAGGVGPAPGDTSGAAVDQNGWLSFALAGLAVAAVGLALLILLVVLIALVAAMVGGYYLMRYWRRGMRTGQSSASAASAPAETPEATATPEVTAQGAPEAGGWPAGVPAGASPAGQPSTGLGAS